MLTVTVGVELKDGVALGDVVDVRVGVWLFVEEVDAELLGVLLPEAVELGEDCWLPVGDTLRELEKLGDADCDGVRVIVTEADVDWDEEVEIEVVRVMLGDWDCVCVRAELEVSVLVVD